MQAADFEAICNLIEEGSALRTQLRERHISPSEFYRFLSCDATARERYARAKEIQMDAMAEEILEIADESSRDTIEKEVRGEIVECADNEWINRSRLRVDTRKWLMSKLAPKRYGDKSSLEVAGPDAGPIKLTWEK